MENTSFYYSIFTTEPGFAPMLARIISGIIILPYGLQKLGFLGGVGIKATLEDFRKRRLPVFIAWLVIISQALGSLALIIGFCSRLAAVGAMIIFTGALIVHAPDGWMMNWYGKKKGEGIEYFVMLLALLLIVVIYGSGSWSIDIMLNW